MKGIYLASFKAIHENYELDYQDINGKRDIGGGDMMDVDLSNYDFIIATPPCNYWSRANYRRDKSIYALKTKHLLVDILNKLSTIDKPWIVENVRNEKLFFAYGLLNHCCYIYRIGRHTYWTNIKLKLDDIIQKPLTEKRNGKVLYLSSQNLSRSQRQGGKEVHEVIERFLETIYKERRMNNDKHNLERCEKREEVY